MVPYVIGLYVVPGWKWFCNHLQRTNKRYKECFGIHSTRVEVVWLQGWPQSGFIRCRVIQPRRPCDLWNNNTLFTLIHRRSQFSTVLPLLTVFYSPTLFAKQINNAAIITALTIAHKKLSIILLFKQHTHHHWQTIRSYFQSNLAKLLL